MRKFILFLTLILSANIGLCDVRTIQTIQPLRPIPPMNFYPNQLLQPQYYNSQNVQDISNISEDLLTQMELKTFNRNYSNDFAENRISRLERQFFGASQNGDLENRYENLKTAVNNYNSNRYHRTPYNNYDFYNGSKLTSNVGRKGFLRNLGSLLIGNYGYPTGFSPQINSYNNLNSGYGMIEDYQTNYGSYNNFSNFNTGSGVHILD